MSFQRTTLHCKDPLADRLNMEPSKCIMTHFGKCFFPQFAFLLAFLLKIFCLQAQKDIEHTESVNLPY